MEDRTIIQLGSPGSVRRGARLNGMYEIETLIAQGGMGEVYKGFNIQTNDPVAIKMILPELARNPEAFALFRREASTLHNLQHEAIVRYFVFSVDPELQRAYLAMEFVDGPSLTKRLTQGSLSLAEATILRRRIAEALGAAHRFGVIHRDISSDNIILPDNDPRRAKIIDFGIARSQRPGEGTLIGDGFAGKYNYVSPEQLGLAGGQVTAKSDIYSFGLVLAEALRGRPIDMNGTQVEIIEKRRSVPDLSDIPASVRPLLQAMLQPLPADRPDMAAVAAWSEEEPVAARLPRAAPLVVGGDKGAILAGAAPERGSAIGRIAAILGILIAIGSVAGTLYVFRDALPWNVAVVNPGPAPTPSGPEAPPHKLPPLPSMPTHADAPNNPTTDNPPSKPESEVVKPTPHVPTADEIVPYINKPPKRDQTASSQPNGGGANSNTEIVAPPAKPSTADVGPKQNDLPQTPPPAKPSKADVEPKQNDLPQTPPPAKPSKADVEPKKNDLPQTPPPAKPATADVEPKKNDLPQIPPPAKPSTADVDPKKNDLLPPPPPIVPPPRAPQNVLAMADAAVGKDYSAELPPFNDGAGAKALVLHAEPNPPDGLTFADLGSGYGQISGKPNRAGQYSFDIIATNPAGATAHMTTRIAVAPAVEPPVAPPVGPSEQPSAPTEPDKPVVALLPPAERAAAFVRNFDGGSCFLARQFSTASDSIAIEGIGSDRATFERFYKTFIQDVGFEPDLKVRTIGPAECPAIDLIRAGGAEPPKIELAGYDVGRGRPLAGTISNLAGRRLDLLVVASDGKVYHLDSRIQPGGASATFSMPMTPDAASINVLQMILAIVSPRPVPVLEGLKSAAAADILPRLRSELAAADGALEAEFFKAVK